MWQCPNCGQWASFFNHECPGVGLSVRPCPEDSLGGMPCVHPDGAEHKGDHQFPHK